MLLTAGIIWFGSGSYQPPPANAASPISVERVMPSASLDQMVDRYVKDHMFDDDKFDPVESTCRETNHDTRKGTYPRALRQVNVGALGASVIKEDFQLDGKFVMDRLNSLALFFKDKLGVAEESAFAVALGFSMFAISGSLVGGFAVFITLQRQNFMKEMKSRYGEGYT